MMSQEDFEAIERRAKYEEEYESRESNKSMVKLYRIEEESISALVETVGIDRRGEGTSLSPHITTTYKTILLGYNVQTLNDKHNVICDEFYPVVTNTTYFTNNKEEVLERIAQQYPAPEWELIVEKENE